MGVLEALAEPLRAVQHRHTVLDHEEHLGRFGRPDRAMSCPGFFAPCASERRVIALAQGASGNLLKSLLRASRAGSRTACL
eukprot:8564968-Alexandrium_andersonii.AAC.1